MDLNVGDVIKMKKQHPCGTNEWTIMRTGMDIRLKCGGCEHQVMLPRKQVEKSFRGFISRIGGGNVKWLKRLKYRTKGVNIYS